MPDSLISPPPGTTAYADSARFKGAFGFPSDSNPEVEYIISWDDAGSYYMCSCMSGTRRGRCKHLDRFNKHPTRHEVIQARKQEEEKARQASALRPVAPVPSVPAPPASPILLTPRFAPAPPSAPPLPKLPASLLAPPPVRRFRQV